VSIFREKLEKCARVNDSRVVLALDLSVSTRQKDYREKLLKRARRVLGDVREHIAGVKVNFQLLLPLGLFEGIQVLIEDAAGYGLPVIMDCKLNDVGHTNEWAARHFFDAGFDALIANPFVGWKDGLERVFSVAKEYGRGIILLVYMSHPGAVEGYGQKVISGREVRFQYEVFAERAKAWRADGVVVGATRPEIIRRVSEIIGGELPIFSPGIGFQGGLIGEAFTAGASYAIVGRSIYRSENPKESALRIKTEINRVLR